VRILYIFSRTSLYDAVWLLEVDWAGISIYVCHLGLRLSTPDISICACYLGKCLNARCTSSGPHLRASTLGPLIGPGQALSKGLARMSLRDLVLEALGIESWEVRLAILSLALFVLMIRHT
jgi:hypothetical protein